MTLKTFTLLTVGLCLAGALASVLLEKTHLFGIGAGTSWSIVLVIGYGIALLPGILDRSESWTARLKYLALSAVVVTAVVTIVIVGGFALQETGGVPLGWRPPVFDGPPILVPFGTCILLFILGAVVAWLRLFVRKARAMLRRARRVRDAREDIAGT